MTRYVVPTPTTLLLREIDPGGAATALAMLGVPPAGPEPAATVSRVFTLADVSSGPLLTPPAACLVHCGPDVSEAWIDRFVVALPFRRRGLGRRLFGEVCTLLRGEATRRLLVPVPHGHEWLAVSLRSQGFGPCTRVPEITVSDGVPGAGDAASWCWWTREL